MLDWETASTATKVTLLGAVGLMGLGIIVAMIGVFSNVKFAMFTGMGLMVLGILTHLVGYAVRFAEARKSIRSQTRQGAGSTRKGRKS